MLIELALLSSGYPDEPLKAADPLVSPARRYAVSLKSNKQAKNKAVKGALKGKRTQPKPKAVAQPKTPAKTAAKKGGTHL